MAKVCERCIQVTGFSEAMRRAVGLALRLHCCVAMWMGMFLSRPVTLISLMRVWLT